MDCSPPGFFCPWDSPGKNTGAGGYALLPGTFPTQGSNLHVLWHATRTGRRLAAPHTLGWCAEYTPRKPSHKVESARNLKCRVASSISGTLLQGFLQRRTITVARNQPPPDAGLDASLSLFPCSRARRGGDQFADQPELRGTCFQTSFKVHPPRSPVWPACLLPRRDSIARLLLPSLGRRPCPESGAGPRWRARVALGEDACLDPLWAAVGCDRGLPWPGVRFFPFLAAPTRSS